jgi:hypothetical protein
MSVHNDEKEVKQEGKLAGKYERWDTDRYTFLDRARQCAELTIPTLIPPDGHNKTTKYYTPWQSVGARGVNTLAAKLLLALLPPNSPFFRLIIDDFTKDKVAGDPSVVSTVEQGLAKVERAVQAEVEGSGIRMPVFQALKHIIVGGNCFMYLPKEGGARVFALDSYVCQRDPKGNPLCIITKECISPEALPKDVLALIDDKVDQAKDPTKEKTIDVYTCFHLEDRKWYMYQEVAGKRIPDAVGEWPFDKPPFLLLRWTAVEGENYGRSYVEEYFGDLVSLEGLSKAVVEASAAAAKIVFLVSPNGVTRAKDITEAESGDAVTGHPDDVKSLQADKQADLTIASQAIQRLEERLAYAFLMNTAIQRNGDRVTAEEIRYMAGELESALGGVYSVLSQEFQLPLVNRLMDRMTKQKRLPELPKGIIRPAIVTGLEALGRGHDLNKLQVFMQTAGQLGPEAIQQINMPEVLSRLALGLSIDPEGLIKKPEQIAEEREAAQQQAMMQSVVDKGVGPGIKAMSDQSVAVGDNQANQGQ